MNKAFEKILERFDAKKQYFQKFYEADGKTEEDEYINKATQLAFDDAKNIMQEVAEEYNNGWIACSERLPEESLNSVIGWDEYRNRCCFVQYYGGRWILGNDIETVKIIAWQPLPEPFKERD